MSTIYMDFKDELLQLSAKIAKQKDQIMTEAATKTAFVLPFIQILGYEVFNPDEVEPEHTCDVGIKKGEKIDYAIKFNGEPSLLVECKHWSQNLALHGNQLFRYYVASKARFAILTNGIQYRFFSDSEKPNVMDTAPFFEVDITDINEYQIEQLSKFHKSNFDEQRICETIPSIKYIHEIRNNFVIEKVRLENEIDNIRAIYNQKFETNSAEVAGMLRQLEHNRHELDARSQKISKLEESMQRQLEYNRRELDARSQKISELEEALRIREETLTHTIKKTEKIELDTLIDYLNMPVPYDWKYKSVTERRHYWNHERKSWSGEPRNAVCSAEVAREFFDLERTNRQVSDAIRRTGLFIQNGSKKRFGEYGVAVAWVRTQSLVQALKEAEKQKKDKRKLKTKK